MEEKNNKKMILAIIGVIILIAGVVGLTIAYFKAKAESENITVSSKRLSIVFSEGEDSLIRATDIEPISDSDIDTLATKKTFTVAKANDTDKDVYLKFELINLEISDNFKDSDLRWALYKEGEIVTEGSFVNVKDSDTLPLANNIYLDTTTPVEYNLYIWIRENEAEQERLMGGSLSGKIQATGTEKSTEGIVNEGVLASGMIPVVYDEENDVWVKAGGDYGWYDYDNQMWANAVTVKETTKECLLWDGLLGDVNGDNTVNESDLTDLANHINKLTLLQYTGDELLKRGDIDGNGTIDTLDLTQLSKYVYNQDPLCKDTLTDNKNREEYLAAEPGTPVPLADITAFYVWVPRYKYKINNTGTIALPSEIDVVFESGVTSTGVDINTTGVATTEYYTHPSFRDGSSVYKTTAYDQSGWDKELSGYWISKFNVSNEDPEYILPNYEIYGSKYGIYDFETEAFDYSTFTDYPTDMHLVKNTEWGAIAYLSQSKYGKMGNNNFTGVNKEIFINSSSDYYTGRSGGGIAGGTIMNTTTDISTTDSETYSFNNSRCSSIFTIMCIGDKTAYLGVGASTTGTIYGIYDMVGGKYEWVAANYGGDVGSSSYDDTYFTDETKKKYYDSYDSTKTYILGDATYETAGWYNDAENSMDDDNPFMLRGGNYSSGIDAGIFSYTSSTGKYSTSRSIGDSYRYTIIP